MSDIAAITNVILDDTEWHAIGTLDESWALISTGGTPVLMVDLPVDVTPVINTKPMFILGGVINTLVSDKQKQAWCRVTEGVGRLSYHLSSTSGFNETEQLRKSLVKLTTQVLHLAGRTHSVELSSTAIKRWQDLPDTIIAGIQVRVADVLTNLMLHKLDNVNAQIALRKEFKTTMYSFQTNILDEIVTIAKDTNLLKILVGVGSDGFSSSMTDIQQNLTDYWKAMTDFMNAGSKKELDKKYEDLISRASFDKSFLSVINVIYQMANAALVNTVVDTEQTERLDTVDDLLPAAKPLLGRNITAADIVSLFGTEQK